jgi:hypothetical protein
MSKFNTPVDLQLDYKNNNLDVFKKWFQPYVEFTHNINGSAMVTGEMPSFIPSDEMIASFNDAEISNYIRKTLENKFTQLIKSEQDFKEKDVSLCADIERHMTLSSINHMALKPEYVKARKDKNAIEMWKLIVSHHTRTSHTLMNKFKAKEGIDSCKQNNRHIDEYCVEFLEKVQNADILGANLDQEELALKFLLHLDPGYCAEVKKLIHDDIVPTTVAAAQAVAIGWSETTKIIEPEMGIKSKSEPLNKESIANVAKQQSKKE